MEPFLAGDYRAEYFNPSSHTTMLQAYMKRTEAKNNRSARALRLDQCQPPRGTLVLVINEKDEIVALTSIITEQGRDGIAAKIYGRFNILPHVPHSIIDRFLEPMIFRWCEERGIQHLFLTINEFDYRVLEWACRRMGERRNMRRPNRFFPSLGKNFRAGLRPLNRLIYERNCWQYVIYYSPQGGWFLDREVKDLEPSAKDIMKREFPCETQNWA